MKQAKVLTLELKRNKRVERSIKRVTQERLQGEQKLRREKVSTASRGSRGRSMAK